MNKLLRLFLVLSIGVVLPTHASAEDNQNACKAILCLGGLMLGQSGGDSCKSAVEEYFSIRVFGKKNRFDPGATASQRMSFLNSCPSDTTNTKNQVNDRFGKMFSAPGS